MKEQSGNQTVIVPPEDFHQIESKLDGITVFAPIPDSHEEHQRKDYKCPNCGASTRFDVSIAGVKCEYCGFQIQPNVQKVGTTLPGNAFTLDVLHVDEQGWGVQRRELRCASCGAELSVTNENFSHTCPFCASNEVNIGNELNPKLRPSLLAPFKITDQQLRQIAHEWLGEGWFNPKTLRELSSLNPFLGIYAPVWAFSSHIKAHWSALVGYERQERYYDHGSKSWQTRTHIDWRPESGDVQLAIENLVVLGSNQISKRLFGKIQTYDLGALVKYSPDFLAGWQAQKFSIPLNSAWETGKGVMREKAQDACKQDIPTSHVRDFQMSADFCDETWRYALLPVYLSTYRYLGRTFQVIVNGQNGNISGQKPVEWWKVWMAIAALLLPGLGLGGVGFILLFLGGIGVIPLALGLILFIIGAIISVTIVKSAIDSEAE